MCVGIDPKEGEIEGVNRKLASWLAAVFDAFGSSLDGLSGSNTDTL